MVLIRHHPVVWCRICTIPTLVQRIGDTPARKVFNTWTVTGLTKSISARVSREYSFRVYSSTRGIFRRVAHAYTRRMGRPQILATSSHQGYP